MGLGQMEKPDPRKHTKQHEAKHGKFVVFVSCCIVCIRGSFLSCVPILSVLIRCSPRRSAEVYVCPLDAAVCALWRQAVNFSARIPT